MPDLPDKKVGVIACSGEEIPAGTVTRLAALKVLETLRPGQTVTICLPLFLAGGQGDRAFAKFHPTITIDGCEKRCAARSTEMYSNKPAVSLVVSELIKEAGLPEPGGKRRLDEAGKQAVEITAQIAAEKVDEILGQSWSRSRGSFSPAGKSAAVGIPAAEAGAAESGPAGQATCACGSGIPIQEVIVGGVPVTLIGLPLMLETFASNHEPAGTESARSLLEMVKIYNALPDIDENALLAALAAEYSAYLQAYQG